MLKRFALAICIGCCLSAPAEADLVISTANTASVVDFESTIADVNNGQFTGAGVSASPTAGQLDSDTFAFSSGTGNLGLGSSSGSVSSGGVYSFNTSATAGGSTASLGIQPTGSAFTAGSVTMSIRNSTGQSIDSWDIAYDVFVFNDQARANSFNFSFSTDGTSFTNIGALDLTSPTTSDGGSVAWVRNARSTNISASVANNGQLFIRWTGDDVSGSGSRDQFALDNISVTAVAVPEPTSATLLGLIAACGLGFYRRK